MKKPVTISLDEEVIKISDELVKSNHEFESRSHLIATLILKENNKTKRVSKK